jgi:hypothetical protein
MIFRKSFSVASRAAAIQRFTMPLSRQPTDSARPHADGGMRALDDIAAAEG